jgi:hypothetical protein
MISVSSVLAVVHLIGLALGAGAATVKLVLLLRCSADRSFVPVYLEVARLITRQIIVGMGLLTLSGIGWLFLGYRLSPLLIVKLVLVGAIWVMGPFIDNVVEPRFRKLAPAPGEEASPAFVQARKQYAAVEAIATGLFYVIIVMWAWR